MSQSFYRSYHLNVLTLCLERNPLLFLTSVESLSGSVEGNGGK